MKGPSLYISRQLAKELGLHEAIVLSQVHYGLRRTCHTFKERKWIYSTYTKWQTQFPFWSLPTIRRIFERLEESGLLESVHLKSYQGKYYTINYSQLTKVGFPDRKDASHTKIKTRSTNQEEPPGLHDRIEQDLSRLVPENTAFERGDQNAYSDQSDHLPSDHFEQSDDQIDQTFVQNDHFEEIRSFQREVQNDHSDQIDQTTLINLITPCIFNKRNTRIKNPPPLTPPPSHRQEEEEEKSKKEKKENTGNSPEFLLFQRMVDEWNAAVQWHLSEDEASLTPRRIVKFAAFIQATPISNLATWKRYCTKIARSRFLKGENASGFRITLDWALKPENAQKILEGAIYDKQAAEAQGAEEKFVEKPWAQYTALLKRHCDENDYSERWFRTCLALAHHLGQATFENWFKGIVAEEAGETLTLETESAFIRDYINTHYEGELQKAIQTAFPPQTQVKVRVADSLPNNEQALPDFCVNHRQRPDVTCSGDADVQVAARTSLSQTSPGGV